MSDRCYMQIECAKKDYDAVLDDYFPEVLEEDGDFVKAADPEANYAYAKELEDWAKRGMIFLALHDAGDEYGGYEVSCDGKKIRFQAYHPNAGLVIPLDEETDKPSQKHLAVKRRAFDKLTSLRAAKAESQ